MKCSSAVIRIMSLYMTERTSRLFLSRRVTESNGFSCYGAVMYYVSTGGSLHMGGASLGSLGGLILSPVTLVARTNTGMTPPVCSANSLCPIAARIL